MGTWTFGRKVAVGLGVMAVITMIVAAVGVLALRHVITIKDDVIAYDARLVPQAKQLESTVLERMGTVRAYVLTGDESLLDTVQVLRRQFFDLLGEMQGNVRTAEERELLARLGQATKTQFDTGDSVAAMRHDAADLPSIGLAFQERVVPISATVRGYLADLATQKEADLKAAEAAASTAATAAIVLVAAIMAIGVIVAVFAAGVLTRMLSQQVGSAVQHLSSSSSELQAAANQNTAGAKEQVASMTEISTTIKQLMSTSKQIADSAQGVARIADSASTAAGGGDQIVLRAAGEITAIRGQVDLVVEHVLDLGRKSQQIGGILEIINELAEQTNILSINATIEAAGAGEAGKRFAVVADEIRKLADRVGGSSKEIRSLIDQIRSAVNTAVMATESGSKAVDAGARQFSEVTAVFRQISDLLRNTTEAAREIELSTKQQSTAVEQVNIAVVNVAQSARESEAASNQVLQTVAELTTLSRDLGRLVRSQGQA